MLLVVQQADNDLQHAFVSLLLSSQSPFFSIFCTCFTVLFPFAYMKTNAPYFAPCSKRTDQTYLLISPVGYRVALLEQVEAPVHTECCEWIFKDVFEEPGDVLPLFRKPERVARPHLHKQGNIISRGKIYAISAGFVVAVCRNVAIRDQALHYVRHVFFCGFDILLSPKNAVLVQFVSNFFVYLIF